MTHHYIVEHLDPELERWSTLEYLSIATETTPSNSREAEHAGPTFHLTSVPQELVRNFPDVLSKHPNLHVTGDEVVKLEGLKPEEVCLLDPKAEEEMSPEDGERFRWFLFGGILGDDPPRDRTAELRKYGFTGRRLGPVQMTTDTAVRVTRLVVEGQIPLEKIPYVDFPEIKVSKNETTEMPFRYVKNDDGSPVMPEGMLDLIKEDSKKGVLDMV